MCSATAPTARPAARARTPTSAPGSSLRYRGGGRAGRRRGFTLIELLVVVTLIAIAAGVTSLALRDPAASQLEHEAARLAALLESARAESRVSGVPVRFELLTEGPQPFRFVGLAPASALPTHWLDGGVTAEIIGARALRLGPEPLIGPQRIVLRLGERNLTLSTDGLAPFAPMGGEPGARR